MPSQNGAPSPWVANLDPRRLVRARQEAGLTQVQLCLRAGVSNKTLSVLEQGHMKPRVSTLAKLAGALNVPIRELLYPVETRED